MAHQCNGTLKTFGADNCPYCNGVARRKLELEFATNRVANVDEIVGKERRED
jgi:hypothetical protein